MSAVRFVSIVGSYKYARSNLEKKCEILFNEVLLQRSENTETLWLKIVATNCREFYLSLSTGAKEGEVMVSATAPILNQTASSFTGLFTFLFAN